MRSGHVRDDDDVDAADPTVTADRVESPSARPTRAACPQLAGLDVAEWSPLCVVAAAIVVIGVSGIRGADYPAHFVRALLWERSGVSAWNNLWYAGHATPTYSVLAPPLMAWIGPFWVVALSSLVATFCFTRLSRDLTPTPTIADHVFAIVIVVNAIVGRAPFALGLAVALTAVLAWRRDRFGSHDGGVGDAARQPGGRRVPRARRRRRGVDDPPARGDGDRAGRRRLRSRRSRCCSANPVGSRTGAFTSRSRLSTLGLLAAVTGSRIVRCGARSRHRHRDRAVRRPQPARRQLRARLSHGGDPAFGGGGAGGTARWRAPLVIALVAAVAWSLQPGVIAARDWWGDESLESRTTSR